MFGSTAVLDSDESSDIDLLLVHDEDVDPGEDPWAEQLLDLELAVARWVGNDLRPVIYSEVEALRGVRNRDPLLLATSRHAITLVGDPTFLRATRTTGAA
jgi:hypothetical protein